MVQTYRHGLQEEAAPRMRNLLFLTYYFPPSGGPGVQRSLKFAKYLPEFGWMPTIVTVRPEHASYPDLDPDLAAEIPESVSVERTYAWDPYALYARMLRQEKQDIVSVGFLGEAETNARQRLARWIRANVFLPDARVGWTPFAAARGHVLMRESAFDAIITTGPPHSTHLTGLFLKLIYRIPWIADFRDSWTDPSYYADLPTSSTARAIDAWLERRVLENTSAAIVVSESMGRQIHASTYAPIEIIENGFDPVDFSNPDSDVASQDFVIRHVGNLTHSRNPAALWRALYELDVRESMPELRISFVGNVEPTVLASASALGLRDFIEVIPYVPHDRAVHLMRESTLLLLAINRVPGAEAIVTGKLFEYVASGRRVLGVGPVRGDAARIIGETGAGELFDYDDSEGMRAYLRACYKRWKGGGGLNGATWERAIRYSRKEQTRRLAGVLDAVAEQGDRSVRAVGRKAGDRDKKPR